MTKESQRISKAKTAHGNQGLPKDKIATYQLRTKIRTVGSQRSGKNIVANKGHTIVHSSIEQDDYYENQGVEIHDVDGNDMNSSDGSEKDDSINTENDESFEQNGMDMNDNESDTSSIIPPRPLLFNDHNLEAEILFQLKLQHHHSTVSHDNGPLCFAGSQHTAQYVSNYLSDWTCRNKQTFLQSANLLALLKHLLPVDALLPKSIALKENTAKDQRLKSTFEYDCCTCGETVYVGKHSRADLCPKCGLKRFTSPKNPLTKRAISKIKYKPLTLQLCELLKIDGFVSAIKCRNMHNSDGSYYIDISDGSVARKHMQAMDARYNQFQQQYPSLCQQCVSIPLLLSFSYDGVQLFKRKHVWFWPMLVSILNLPPPLRKSVGVGLFSLAVMKAKGGSAYETFLLECFIKDLKLLYKGVVITIQGTMYYVQARLIVHCYDTSALESMLDIEGHNSYAGCSLCLSSPG